MSRLLLHVVYRGFDFSREGLSEPGCRATLCDGELPLPKISDFLFPRMAEFTNFAKFYQEQSPPLMREIRTFGPAGR